MIRRYDINDYRLKTELTAHSLYTSVVAALRGYAEITARIRAEQEAILAVRSKSQFLAGMSHELRTPLNAIIGFSDILSHLDPRTTDLERYRDYVTTISDNGSQLLGIVNALLDMASLDAGHYELREQVIITNELLASRVAAAAERAAAAGVTLTLQPSEQVTMLLADNTALSQILDNLLSNAIKFSPSGGNVKLSATLDAGHRPTLTVADHGIGIPAERHHDLFRPFTQVDAGHDRRFEGTGLGLAIVKGLVTLHGGTIEVASVEGEGTTMTIRLPAARLIAG